ncbi:hypothetical protein Mapa_012039 [Marchantia paleacea]|nr:hypothetical protein Mapa_012039 [Marchantia paleacea]
MGKMFPSTGPPARTASTLRRHDREIPLDSHENRGRPNHRVSELPKTAPSLRWYTLSPPSPALLSRISPSLPTRPITEIPVLAFHHHQPLLPPPYPVLLLLLLPVWPSLLTSPLFSSLLCRGTAPNWNRLLANLLLRKPERNRRSKTLDPPITYISRQICQTQAESRPNLNLLPIPPSPPCVCLPSFRPSPCPLPSLPLPLV